MIASEAVFTITEFIYFFSGSYKMGVNKQIQVV